MRLRARPERERGPVDRERHVAQQERQAADVILVAVGRDAAVDAMRVLAEVREVGKHEVDARHVGLGEHEAAVEEHDAPVDLDAGAVAPDLAEASEEDDADRDQPRAASRRLVTPYAGCRCTCRARSSVPAGAGPSGRPALTDRVPEHPHHRLRRDRVRRVVARLERERLEQASVRLSRRDDVALLERRDHLAVLDAGPVRRDADDPDRADREQRQRERVVAAVDLEAARSPSDERRPSPTGCPLRPSRRRCSAHRARVAAACRSTPCGRCGSGCRTRSPGSAVAAATALKCASRPACDGRL